MIGRSKTYTVLACLGAAVLIVAGCTIGFAAISFSVANPSEIFSWHRLTPLSAILTMVTVGATLMLSGLAIWLDATTGYHFV